MSAIVNTRNELYRKFQARVKDSQSSLEEEQELEHEKNMLKTFIIESNVSHTTFIDESEHFENPREIEPDLIEVTGTRDEGHTFYLDTEDERFWSLYTLIASQAADDYIDKITRADQNGLDRLWIPNETQREFLNLGTFKGAGMKQRGKDAFPEDFVDVSDMRLELDGDDALKFYDTFKDAADIDQVLSLSRIILRRKEGDDFLTERITNSGAFTARAGTNIQIHLNIVNKIKETYQEVISAIEENHRLSYDERDHGVRIDGQHLTLSLENTISDVDEFITHLVDGGPPFRLVGPSTELGEDYRKVRAVDLHNGDKVTLEIEPTEIRIYLSENACGNTALRIFTNIQQHFDPAAVLEIKGVENV